MFALSTLQLNLFSVFNFLTDDGTSKIIKGIEDWAGTIATWATGFTTWFLNYMGSYTILLIPIVLMFIVLGIETIRRLIHGF